MYHVKIDCNTKLVMIPNHTIISTGIIAKKLEFVHQNWPLYKAYRGRATRW